jgi:uncharacterized protein
MKEMNKIRLIGKVEEFAKSCLSHYDSAHDWWHLERVKNLALILHSAEATGDPLIIEISALLHDIGDKKFNKGDSAATNLKLSEFLRSLDIEGDMIDEIVYINNNISFSKGHKPASISDEFKIVQDADRLDALGAIGIARAFNYGGFRNNTIYDPVGHSPSTIGHFYEKLFLLKELMNTPTGKLMAIERHSFLEVFLNQFLKEWGSSKREEL